MIMSNRNILERVSTIEAENSGILFGSQSDASEENIINNCIIEDNNGVGLSQNNCNGTIITNNRFARNGLENLTVDASNRTICTNNRFFKHLGGIGNIGWDDSVDSKFCDNFLDNQNDTNATSLHRNGICIGQQFSGADPTTHRCMISNNHIVNYANTGIWIKDADDVNYNADGSLAPTENQPKEDAGAFIISNNFLARSSVGVTGNGANNTDIKVGRTIFKIIVEGNNAEDIDLDDSTLTTSWGFSSDVQLGSTKHTVIDKFTETDRANDRLEPAVFVSATYDGGDLTGDPSAPLGIYAQHELKGSTSTNAYTHSIMGYGLNNSAGDNDAIGTSGRARKNDIANGIGDAAGVWGSAYQYSNRLGGVMSLEGSIYQNASTDTVRGDRLGVDFAGAARGWSTSLHLNSDSEGSRAISAIAIDSEGNTAPFTRDGETITKSGYWNGIIIDANSFGSGGASAGATGTVGLNCGSWSTSLGYPEHGIKFGKVKYGITFNSDVATGGYHLYSESGSIKTFGNLNVTGAILAQSTGETSLILNADSDDNSVEKAFIDFQINEVVKGNIAVNEAVSGLPLEINSAVNHNIALVSGGGNVGINNNSPTEKLDVVGNIKASGDLTATNITVASAIVHEGDTDTKLAFTENSIAFSANNTERFSITQFAVFMQAGYKLAFIATSGENSSLKSGGTNNGDLLIESGSASMAQFKRGNSVDLFYNGNKKFETLDNGARISGSLYLTETANNSFLVIEADTDNNDDNSASFIDFKADNALVANIFYRKNDNLFEINTAGTANITKIGGGTGDDKRVQINSDTLQIASSRSPASNATGEAGQIAWDANYVYVCTAANTWKRAALSTY